MHTHAAAHTFTHTHALLDRVQTYLVKVIWILSCTVNLAVWDIKTNGNILKCVTCELQLVSVTHKSERHDK